MKLILFFFLVCAIVVFFVFRTKNVKLTPEQLEEYELRRRRKKRGCLFVLLVFFFLYVVFAIFDAAKFKMKGYRDTWVNIGKHVTEVVNPHYALSPDRKELVVTYELETKYSFPSWYNPGRAARRTAETRIPLDPPADGLKKCFVEVVVDPDARPSRTLLTHYENGREVYMPSFTNNLESLPDDPGELNPPDPLHVRRDGMNRRLTLRQEDLPILSENLMFAAGPFLIPYGRDGERYVMISAENVLSQIYACPPFIQFIQKEHPEVNTEIWDRNFSVYCGKLLLVPFGFLYDMLTFPFLCLLGLMLGGG